MFAKNFLKLICKLLQIVTSLDSDGSKILILFLGGEL